MRKLIFEPSVDRANARSFLLIFVFATPLAANDKSKMYYTVLTNIPIIKV